jgi:hypothetical protein
LSQGKKFDAHSQEFYVAYDRQEESLITSNLKTFLDIFAAKDRYTHSDWSILERFLSLVLKIAFL